MEFLSSFAEGFIGLFNAGAEQFMGYITGIIPLLIVLMTAFNALIALIGQDRVEGAMKVLAKFTITRYTIMPFLAMLFLCNPMAYSFGRFLPEKYKVAFYDSAVSFCHPITGLFPHANAGELFVYLGIADGITQLGLNSTDLAVRYFLVGLVVILIRGILTEKIFAVMSGRSASKKEQVA